MNADPFDLEAYRTRIGYEGRFAASLPVLSSIVEHHALAIPFENLDILQDRTIPLDLPSIHSKLVVNRRGGYCFEHNALLAEVLRRIGFDVTTHLGRGRWRVPPDVTLPRTHMVLTVAIAGERFLVDGGFGGVGLTSALKLHCSDPQASLFEEQRVSSTPDGWLVQARIAGEWRDLYTFLDEPVPGVDLEVANWFTATHPESRFRQNLIVCGATREARFVLFNRELTTYGRSGQKTATRVEGPEHLLDVLSSRFGLCFPAGTCFAAPRDPWTAPAAEARATS